MSSEAQIRATSKYIREHTRRFTLQCNTQTDADIIAYLAAADNYTQLLKSIIREKIAQEARGSTGGS